MATLEIGSGNNSLPINATVNNEKKSLRLNFDSKFSLALGETEKTAYRGDRGKIAYDHSQSYHFELSDITKARILELLADEKIYWDGAYGYVDIAVDNLDMDLREYVDGAILNLISTAPDSLNSLNELATAINNDPNYSATIYAQLAQKANLNHTHNAADINISTANFNKNLTSAENTVQKALDKLDDLNIPIALQNVEVRIDDPATPAIGRIWLRSDL